MNTLIIPEQNTPHFHLPKHTITWTKDIQRLKDALPADDLKHYMECYELALNSPKKAKKSIEVLYSKHASNPDILNLYSYILYALKKIKKGDALTVKNYKDNPSCLLARVNYADFMLRKKRYKEVPDIFDGKWSLAELAPQTKVFHVSTFRAFMVVMGFYHCAINEKEKAICYHYLAHRVDPHHPSIKILGKKLYRKPFSLKAFLTRSPAA